MPKRDVPRRSITSSSLKSAVGLAVPASLAAMITPLLGIVDTAFLARGAGTAEVAGVALAGAVFSVLYWSLGFLRMSVAGLTAQTTSAQDQRLAFTHFLQGVLLGAVIGFMVFALREPIATFAQNIMAGQDSKATPEALHAMAAYVRMRLLAAPFAIASYAAIGFLTGQGRTGQMMIAVGAITLINGVLDWYYVIIKGEGAVGIAMGTAIAETAGFFILALLIGRILWPYRRDLLKGPLPLSHNLKKVLVLNGDIFLRTFALAVVFAWFTRAGARFGDLTLAANQVLMQITLAAGLLLDGPAIATESLVGRAIGADQNRRAAFHTAVTSTSVVGAVTALGLTLMLLIFGAQIVRLIVPEASSADLATEAETYLIWAALSPLLLFVPFQLDGIYIGATRGRALRNSMLAATAIFGLGTVVLFPLGNHGLWIAFGLFMLVRGLYLLAAWRGFEPLFETGEKDRDC